MIINIELLDNLTKQAKTNPRFRQSYDLRTTVNDNSQRILNAIEPESLLPVHRHRSSTETITVLRGRCVQNIYNDEGELTDRIFLEAAGEIPAMSVELGQWHRLESLVSGTVILECKDGAYVPLDPDDVLTIK